MKRKILVIHGRDEGRPVWAGLLKGYGYAVRTVSVGAPAVSVANEFIPDAILCDARNELADSLRLLRTLGWVHWIPIVVLVDGARSEFAAPLDALPIVTMVRVPCTAREVLAVLGRALDLPTPA